ncbi:peptidoglycan recognition protein family protein [Corynebacterium phocae]|uniref:peptidoglycan recognition protein family protein n=1 Tax=Corynebacterium phocae TaxID=161895 RepID=UPI0009516098|nr:N-acetylmuramoyl-L-alanine amidase [Corynebacterium phocae]KAA8723573.1 N-acetylmuramoyl-L-alanine amidase [Corynebacterium phocae]
MTNAFVADMDILTANDDGLAPAGRNVLYVHTFEGRDLDAAAMARYQLSPAAGGSYHVVIDRDGVTARENDDPYIPWAAMFTGNRTGWHVCLAGRAAFTREQWLARPKQLGKLSEIMAAYSREYGIELVKLTPADLRARKSGVAGHWDVSLAWRESDHTDPGANFPWDVVIAGAKKLLAAPAPAAPSPAPELEAPAPGTKYPSYVDGRELRFSEYLRHIDYKVTRLYESRFPGKSPDIAAGTFNKGSAGPVYPSYVDTSKEFTLDQYLRLIDVKLTELFEEVK